MDNQTFDVWMVDAERSLTPRVEHFNQPGHVVPPQVAPPSNNVSELTQRHDLQLQCCCQCEAVDVGRFKMKLLRAISVPFSAPLCKRFHFAANRMTILMQN